MTFQSTVRRNFTTGFAGELLRDGPTRAKSGRIASASVGSDPAASTNRMSRAFGFSADMPIQGTTNSLMEAAVIVGGANFYGILGNPKHYALSGTNAGSLAPTIDLPIGTEAEFFDMATGLCVEIFNHTESSRSVSFGDRIAYVTSAITALQNPLALPYGALISLASGDSVPAGYALIPNARVINPESLSASALGALVSGYTVAQLTQ